MDVEDPRAEGGAVAAPVGHRVAVVDRRAARPSAVGAVVSGAVLGAVPAAAVDVPAAEQAAIAGHR